MIYAYRLEAMQRVMTSCIKKGNNSVLYEKHLVYYVPFLPIERQQLLQCIDARLRDLRDEYLGIQVMPSTLLIFITVPTINMV
jgi:hypothetical protein